MPCPFDPKTNRGPGSVRFRSASMILEERRALAELDKKKEAIRKNYGKLMAALLDWREP